MKTSPLHPLNSFYRKGIPVLFAILLLINPISAQKVYTTYLWHMDQPVYWAEKSKDKPDSKQFVEESHRLKTAGFNRYPGSTVAHPTNNLEEIFSKADRVNAYQTAPRNAVNSIRNYPDAGAQLSISAGLMENIRSLGEKNQWGYGSGWMNSYKEAIGWQTSGGYPRLDVVAFTWDHALSPLVSERTLNMQIRTHQYTTEKYYGSRSRGYWPAEAAFSERIIKTLVECGIEWSVVANSHLARTLSDYVHPFSINGNIDAPNRADQVPTQGLNWFEGAIDGRGSRLAVPYSYQAHKAQYIDPVSGTAYTIDVVPMCNYFSYIDGYSGANAGEVQTKIEPYSSAERPSILLLAHDGDNAWGGGYTYYHEAVPGFTGDASAKGYRPTTIQQFLDDHPVPAGAIVRVEDGAWVNADSDWGHPQFINWLWPLYSKPSYRFNPDGWTEDARNWAVITATENYMIMAEDLEGGNLRMNYVAEGGSEASNAEKAWHFFFGGLNSGFMYYGKAEDMEVKPSMTGAIAIEYASKVINAHPGVDQTPPSVFIPQRFPYNPGRTGFGPLTAYQQVSNSSDFHIWTFAYDVSGLSEVTLKYRIDNDCWNPIGSIQNDTYAGGDEVQAWQSIPMSRRPMAADPANDGELNFFIQPVAQADLCYAELTALKDVLVDYYVEATDAKGNVFRTPIQHVYVGEGTGSDEGDPDGDPITVSFLRPADWSGTGVKLWAWSAGGNLFDTWPGVDMTDNGNGWFSYTFDQPVRSVNVIFSNNGSPQSVDINGVTNTSCYEYDALSGNKFTVKEVSCIQTSTHQPATLQLSVYPQPASDRFVVTLPNVDVSKGFELIIRDLSGKIAGRVPVTQPTTVVDCETMLPGVYFLQAISVDMEPVFSSRLLIK
ncbi:MAG: starch-binding protein [Paludibacter sp.]|nr:starch-binding protein [Paludibacter sp.]